MPMLFLNAFMGLFALAFTVPVAIHILNRSRFKVVPWGPMFLLESILQKNRRRVQVEQMILLLVRALIPVFLAACMMLPVIFSWQPLVEWVVLPVAAAFLLLSAFLFLGTKKWVLIGVAALLTAYVLFSTIIPKLSFFERGAVNTTLVGNTRSTMVLLVDNSYSMEAGAGKSNYAMLKDATRAIINNLPRGSEISVINMGGTPTPLTDEATLDLDLMRDRLDKSEAGYGAADVVGSLDLASKMLQKAHNAKRDLVVLSDFQKVDWQDAGIAARGRVVESLQKTAIKPSLTLFHLGREAKDNVAVESLVLSRSVVGRGQKFSVRATIRNFGEVPWPALNVSFKADGQDRAEPQQIALGPGEQGQVIFGYAFDKPGSHVVEVSVDADPLKADNTLQAAIPVLDHVPVLLVSGNRSPEPLKSATGFLEIALRPFAASGKIAVSDLIDTHTISATELDAKSLADQHVVVLANVALLADPQVKLLEEWVRDGGSLIIFAGNRVNTDWYNEKLFNTGAGLLPLKIAGIDNKHEKDEKLPGAHLLSQHMDHPALDMFNDPTNGDLSDGETWVWQKLDDKSDTAKAAGPSLSVMARYDTGDPFLTERRFGDGRVIQCATSVDAEWSNMPVREFFLPLIQQLMIYAASAVEPPRNIEVGQPLVAFLPHATVGKKAGVIDPGGTRTEVTVTDRGSRGVVNFPATQRPGLYTLEGPDGVTHYVVTMARTESDLHQLPDVDLKRIAEQMHGTVVTDATQYIELDKTRRFGREIWRWFLLTLLGFCFGEMVLQQWFARRAN